MAATSQKDRRYILILRHIFVMIPETPNKCLPHTRHRTILHTLPRKQDSLKHQAKKRISTNANVTTKQKMVQAITIKAQRSWGPDLVLIMSKYGRYQ